MKIISSVTFRRAQGVAQQLGLKRNEWVYAPWDGREMDRSERLAGIRCDPEDLIGPFTAEERFILTVDHKP